MKNNHMANSNHYHQSFFFFIIIKINVSTFISDTPEIVNLTPWQAGKQNLSLVASEKTEAVYRCQVGDNEGEDHVVKDYVDDAIVMMTMLMVMVPGEDDEEDEDREDHDFADAIAGPLS